MTRVKVNFSNIEGNGHLMGLAADADGKLKLGGKVRLHDAEGNTADGVVLMMRDDQGRVRFDVTNFTRHA
jgi:hypothetical protein